MSDAALDGGVRPGTALAPLVETAQAHQQLAEQSLLQLHSHTAGLDEVVRDEIRRSFITECGALVEEARRASEALRYLQRSARRHFHWMGVLSAILTAGAAVLVLAHWLPNPEEAARLRAEQARLGASITWLSQMGARLQLRRCGPTQRLCVQIDRTAPVYGSAGDFYVLKGY